MISAPVSHSLQWICGFKPSDLSPVESLRDEAGPNQCGRKERERDEALAILRCVSLLPDEQREPRLEDVGHFVHAGHDNGTLFVVGGTDFVGPADLSDKQSSQATV